MAKNAFSSPSLRRDETQLGWFYFFFQLLLLPSILTALNGLLSSPFSKAEVNFTYFLLNFMAMIWIFHRFLGASFRVMTGHPILFCQAIVLGLFAYWVTSAFTTWALHQLDPGFVNRNDASIVAMTRSSYYLMALGTALLVPPVEECFFRGLMFRNAKDRLTALEYQIFTELREDLARQAARVQESAAAVAAADTLCSLAAVAVQRGYCRPEITLGQEISITDGRHPVVEAMLKDSLFVPNDTQLGGRDNQVSIITGPNMAGKSTYMRQVALIVLMAQMGSFVPARSARLGIVDRVFTRIGASDDLASGQSTFMVEMAEVANILKYATSRSLLILDEIGRGTSTYDGMSIARAVLEYAANPKRLGAKTLFATHYHELSTMEDKLPNVKNYNIAVKKRGDQMIFLRKIVPGATDDSYGIEVAKLAGLPGSVISRAREILAELEAEGPQSVTAPAKEPEAQVSMMDLRDTQVCDALRAIQVETLTPIEAMNELYKLRKMLD